MIRCSDRNTLNFRVSLNLSSDHLKEIQAKNAMTLCCSFFVVGPTALWLTYSKLLNSCLWPFFLLLKYLSLTASSYRLTLKMFTRIPSLMKSVHTDSLIYLVLDPFKKIRCIQDVSIIYRTALDLRLNQQHFRLWSFFRRSQYLVFRNILILRFYLILCADRWGSCLQFLLN